MNNQNNNNQTMQNIQLNQQNINNSQPNFLDNRNITTKNVKLTRFKYKIKDSSGKKIESYFDAEKKIDVESYLLNQGYEILSVEEDKISTGLGLAKELTRKMSPKNLNFFLTQLSTYLKAGIPLLDSMEILSKQTKKNTTKMQYKKIVFDLNRGLTFSECLRKRGNLFPKMLINMLKTSEMTGDLTGVLDDMAAYYKRKDSNRKQVINAMTYPAVLMIFAIAVLTFVITYVVPSFTSMYSSVGTSIPKITQVIMDISNFIIKNGVTIAIILVLVGISSCSLYKASKQFRYSLQWIVMHIPIIKNIIKYNQLVTFTSTFATLIKHDVLITDSMDVLNAITENEIYKGIIQNAINNLSKGNGVSVAFKGHWAFPETAYEMLVTGERTGKLGEMMEHVTTYYQEEQTNIISRLKSLIEPVMIILLAVIVGVILLAVVVPMFDIYSTII